MPCLLVCWCIFLLVCSSTSETRKHSPPCHNKGTRPCGPHAIRPRRGQAARRSRCSGSARYHAFRPPEGHVGPLRRVTAPSPRSPVRPLAPVDRPGRRSPSRAVRQLSWRGHGQHGRPGHHGRAAAAPPWPTPGRHPRRRRPNELGMPGAPDRRRGRAGRDAWPL